MAHRIDTAGALAGGLFGNGNPFSDRAGTTVGASWLNDMQENIARAVELSGQDLTKGDFGQLAQAIQLLASVNVAQAAAIQQGVIRPQTAVWTPQAGRQGGYSYGGVGDWTAGETTVQPTNANTDENTDYGAGTVAFPEDAWPFQTWGPQVASTTVGTYPALFQGQNLNHYRNGIYIPPFAALDGFYAKATLVGQYKQDGSDPAATMRRISFIIEPEMDPGAAISPNKALALQTDAFATDVSNGGPGSTLNAWFEIEIMTLRETNIADVFPAFIPLAARLRGVIGDSGSTFLTVDRTHQIFIEPTQAPPTSFDIRKGHMMGIRWKTDGDGVGAANTEHLNPGTILAQSGNASSLKIRGVHVQVETGSH